MRIEKQTWDFGSISNWKNDTAWFRVHNESKKILSILPTHYNQNFKILRSAPYADPGSSIEIGIVFYTDQRGKFHEKVPIYFNLLNEPLVFNLKGEIKSFSPDAQIYCPKVNDGPPAEIPEKIITLEVRDIKTDVLLNPDRIFVTDRENHKIKIEKSGLEFEISTPPGQYRVVSEKLGYEDYSSSIILEPYKDRFIIYMEKKTDEPTVTKKMKSDTLLPKPEEKPHKERFNLDSLKKIIGKNRETVEEEPIEWLEEGETEHLHSDTLPIAKKENEPVDTVIDKKEEPKHLNSNLDSTKYKNNNLILIVDISGSMKREGKLDNLKSSITQTIAVFRNDDIVGLISLNANASILQEPTQIKEKDSLTARIQRMKAEGATNGGAALQMAYSLALKNYIPGGNNQVIICTDGVFSSGNMLRRDLEKMIAENAAKGIHLSCVGFGNEPKAVLFMNHLSELGHGNYVQIMSSDDNYLLLEMIKNQSLKP